MSDVRPPVPAAARAGVVVVSYGPPEDLARNLATFDAASWEVVVVDNLSTAGARHDVTALAREHGWHLVAMDTNAGFGAGSNAGAARALELGCDALLLLNPDAFLDADAALALVEHVRREPDALVAPTILRPDGSVWFAGARLDLRTGTTYGSGSGVTEGMPWLTGACFAVSAAGWRRVGGFDGDYFLYWEDVDLSWRWLEGGGTVVVRDDVTCVHEVGGTQGGGGRGTAKSATYYSYNCRNRLLFAALRLPRRQRLRWLAGAGRHAYRVVLRGGRRQLRHPGPTVGAALRGTGAGVLEVLRRW